MTEETKVKLIEAVNPTPEEMTSIVEGIKVNFDFDVNVKPVAFNFKKSKDKSTGIETVREALQLAVPYPSVQGILSILEVGGKQLDLLIEAVEGVVTSRARDLISEDIKLNAGNFPVDKLSWSAIANMPKVARRGGGIPKETWEAFSQSYLEVMPELTGKSVEQISNATKLIMSKFSAIKTNENVLNFMVEQLSIYGTTPDAEEYEACISFLQDKAETFLNVTDEELLANL